MSKTLLIFHLLFLGSFGRNSRTLVGTGGQLLHQQGRGNQPMSYSWGTETSMFETVTSTYIDEDS